MSQLFAGYLMFLLTVLYFLHLKKPTLLHVERVLFDPQCQLRRVFQVSVSEAHEIHNRSMLSGGAGLWIYISGNASKQVPELKDLGFLWSGAWRLWCIVKM